MIKDQAQSGYQTGEVMELRVICFLKGIHDLLIKYSYALFIILKAHLLKVPTIT